MYSYDRRFVTASEEQAWQKTWQVREAIRRDNWILEQSLPLTVAVAENISNSAWERGVSALIDNVQSMKKQVDRFGGIVNALGQGHGTTLKQQMTETTAILRTLQRRLGD